MGEAKKICREYFVKGVAIVEDEVKLELVEPISKSKMEIIPKDDMEKAFSSAFKAMEKVTGVAMKPMPYPPGFEPNIIRILLSKEEYAKLGKPTVDDQFLLTLERQSEGSE